MREKRLIAMIVFSLSIFLIIYGITISGYHSRVIYVDREEKLDDSKTQTYDVPFSMVEMSGLSEFGFAKGYGEFVTTDNPEMNIKVINPRELNPKIEPVLYDISILEEYSSEGVIPVIVQLKHCSDIVPRGKTGLNTFASAKSEISSKIVTHKSDIRSLCSVSVDVEIDRLQEVAQSDSVSKLFLDRKYQILLNESVFIMNVDSVWGMPPDGIDGTGVTIAVLDTGLNFSHPDFWGKNILSYSFVPGETVDDNHMHGTHCAGIASGTGNASEGNFTGVAPGSDLLVGKVLSNLGYGYTSWIVSGIEWAIENNADIISLSLGGTGTDGNDPLSLAVDNAVDSGVIVVVAAGNSGETGPMSVSSPGVSKKAITVGASTKTEPEVVWVFSSMGPTSDGRFKPEVVAPGVNICSTKALGFLDNSKCGNDYYWPMSGTSMAAPHVAGVAALLLQKYPSWTHENVKSALILSSVELDQSIFAQGNGRVDAYRAINIPILTNPSVLNMGRVFEGNLYQDLRIENINNTEIEIIISVSNLTNLEGVSGEWLEVNETNITIPSGEGYTLSVKTEILEDFEGIFYGKVFLEIGNDSYSVPVSVSKMGSIFVGVTYGDGNLSKPSYVVLYDHKNFKGLISWAGYNSPEYNQTIILPSGNYSLHVFGDLNDVDTRYVLGDYFELSKGEHKDYIFNISESKKINIPMQSKDGITLDVYNYEHLIVCRHTTPPERIRLSYVIWGLGEAMDGTLHVSGSTCSDRSIQIQVRGSPTRGHLYHRAPGEGLYDMPGYEWAWRWENRDISDEDYLLAWTVQGNVIEDIDLTFDIGKTSVFKEYYNFAGYAPFTQNFHPHRFMARIVFWLSPDWFESISFWKRVSAPVNKTLYLMGNGWTYRGDMYVKYPNSTSQSTTIQRESPNNINSVSGIKVSNTPIYRTHHFGTPPFQLPHFMNFVHSTDTIRIRTNAPLFWNEDKLIYISKDYDNILNPTYFIYRGGSLLASAPSINTHEIWTKGIIKDFSAVSSYQVNITLPLKYSVYNMVDIFAEFHGSGSDVNPPSPYNFFVNPSFRYNVSFPVQVDFSEELSLGEIYYKTDKQGWILIDKTDSGTSLTGLINITDEESTNVSIKILATDLAGNNISYVILPVSVLQREIYFNLYSNQSSAYLGDVILFNGIVYDPLDSYFSGVKIKYFVNGEYIDFDRTDFNENINTIDLRMPSYQMCMGCFEKKFTVPIDTEEDYLNFTVLFEGSGPYQMNSETVTLDLIHPFKLDVFEYNQTVKVGTTTNFEFNITNQLDISDTYDIDLESNVSWMVSGLPTNLELSPSELNTLSFNVDVPKINQGLVGEFIVTITSLGRGYNKQIYFIVKPNITLTDEEYPFNITILEQNKTVDSGKKADFEFGIRNRLDFEDEYEITFTSDVSWTVSGLPVVIPLNSTNQSLVQFSVTTPSVSQTTLGRITVDILSLESMYDRTIDFWVKANPLQTSGSSSGGSISTPPLTPSTYSWEEDNFQKALKSTDKINFVLKEKQHKVTILSVSQTSVVIQIESEPILIELNVGETKLVDVDFDGVYDLSIYLEKITGSFAYLTFESISQPTEPLDEVIEEDEVDSTSLPLAVVDPNGQEKEEQKKISEFIVLTLIILSISIILIYTYFELRKPF